MRGQVTGRIGLAALLMLAGASHGQAAPGGATGPSFAPVDTMTLDYRDVPMDTVVNDFSKKFGVIVIRTEAIGGTVTVVSGTPVGKQEAAALVNDALWPLGFRIYSTPSVNGGPLILRVCRRPTTKAPAEMRVWRQLPSVPSMVPALSDMPGVSVTATMKLQYENAPLSAVLDDMGKAFGFAADAGKLGATRVMLRAPQPLPAAEALGLVSELLAWDGGWGYKLQAEKAEDIKLETRTLVRIVEAPMRPLQPEFVDFGFDDAPLTAVMDELSRRSGFPVTNAMGHARVTIHEKLKMDPVSTDVGPLVARLNEILEPQGAVIEETSRAGAGGKPEAVLAVMAIEAARKTLLAPPGMSGPVPAVEGWAGVDMNATMTFRYENATVPAIMAEMSQRFGFIAMLDFPIVARLTAQAPQPMNAAESVAMLNSLLNPIGYASVQIPAQSVKGTILRVMTTNEARVFLQVGLRAAPPATAPAGAGRR